jgi:hypothetical protein
VVAIGNVYALRTTRVRTVRLFQTVTFLHHLVPAELAGGFIDSAPMRRRGPWSERKGQGGAYKHTCFATASVHTVDA